VLIDAGEGHLRAAVARAAAVLRDGRVVAVPTDTVYGIAALPTVPGATGRLFELKGRGADVPVAVLCADAAQALALAEPSTLGEDVRRIAERLWPGPLTLVLDRRPGLGWELGRPGETVGVRCPDHALVRALAGEVGPIATTSANRHGEPTPATAAGVARALAGDRGDGPALVLDGGPCAAPPSMVVDATGSTWRVLREGEITLSQVEAAAKP
jgi:tRNA threonylcarbamoyl adenosine modification protein (Sua5/YciO/YrdC/YwlC family)